MCLKCYLFNKYIKLNFKLGYLNIIMCLLSVLYYNQSRHSQKKIS
jgi:hypothetical protein